MLVYTEFTKNKVFEQLTLATVSSAQRRHGRVKVSITECNLPGRKVMVDCSSSLPVRSQSGITAKLCYCHDCYHDPVISAAPIHLFLPLFTAPFSLLLPFPLHSCCRHPHCPPDIQTPPPSDTQPPCSNLSLSILQVKN